MVVFLLSLWSVLCVWCEIKNRWVIILLSLGTRVFIIEERKYRLLRLVLDLIYKYHPPTPPGELESKYLTISLSPPMPQDLTLDRGLVLIVHHTLRHNLKVWSENMSLEKETIGFVAHTPISIAVIAYIPQGIQGGWQVTINTSFFGAPIWWQTPIHWTLSLLVKTIMNFKSVKHSRIKDVMKYPKATSYGRPSVHPEWLSHNLVTFWTD